MDQVRNPFSPGAGTPPPELAGRAELMSQSDIMFQRTLLRRSAKSFIAVGLRGVGKTVILNQAGEIAKRHGYRICQIEAHEEKSLALLLIPALRRLLLELDRGPLNELVKRGIRVLKSFASGLTVRYGEVALQLDLDSEPGSADSGDLEADLPELILAVGRAAASRNTAIALIIDEIQYLGRNDLSALIMSLHRIAQETLPLVLVAAGLPQVVALSGHSKSYAERLFDFPQIGPLSPDDARLALKNPAREEGVTFTKQALDRIIELTGGYPYFLQEWGYHSWNEAPAGTIRLEDVDRATQRALRTLDRGFFRVRYDRLTPREKSYCLAMAGLGAGIHRSGNVSQQLGARVQAVAPLRDGLIRKGMIYSPAHGDVAFTVPLFEQFLHRISSDT